MTYTRIAGTGRFLPEKILTNFDLEKMVDTTAVSYTHLRAHETGVEIAYAL